MALSEDAALQFKKLATAAALVTLMVPFALHLANSDGHLHDAQSFCPLKVLTGWRCPGCGMTKSLVAIYAGDLASSVHYHAFGLPLFIVCVLCVIFLPMEISSGKRYISRTLASKRLLWATIVSLFVYHLWRIWLSEIV